MLFEPVELKDQKARIVVVGVGGGGGNALNRMIEDGMASVDFIAINTDAQDLEINNSQIKLQIGRELTKGLGAGADSEVGSLAVQENKEIIISELESADMVFITAGMGGGTGTGAAPEISKISKELGILTVGIVTKPFIFEGPKRTKRALDGIDDMKKNCDTLLVIPNETLLEITDDNTTVNQSFKLADSVLHQACKGISDLINKPGLINLDFADVRTVMKDMGDALMGTGLAQGEERAILAAQEAINSPLLLDSNIGGAKGLLVNISGPESMTIHELNAASKVIYNEAGPDANIILGCVIDENLKDEIKVTVIATGLNDGYKAKSHSIAKSIEANNTTKESIILEKPKEKIEGKTLSDENNDAKEKDILTFGDDHDVPAFIRNRN